MARASVDESPLLHRLGSLPINLALGRAGCSAGATEPAQSPACALLRSIEEQTIDQIDIAQVCNSLPRLSDDNPNSKVAVQVSHLGIKLINPDSLHCFERLAMHTIVACTAYDADCGGLTNVVILAQGEQVSVGHAHVFQTDDAAVAERLCLQVRESFQSLEREARVKVLEEKQRREQQRRGRGERRLRHSPTPSEHQD